MKRILGELIERRPELDVCRSDILEAFEVIRTCFESEGKMLLCGNGGSAADCEHWSGELLKGFASKRPLPQELRSVMPLRLSEQIQGGLPAIPLPSLMSVSTAYANDVSADLTFAQLVWALGSPGDVLVGISTSGNAVNVCFAAESARAKEIATVGLTGSSGGHLAELVDVAIRVPADLTHEVQEYHESVYHCLCLMLESHFFPAEER